MATNNWLSILDTSDVPAWDTTTTIGGGSPYSHRLFMHSTDHVPIWSPTQLSPAGGYYSVGVDSAVDTPAWYP